MKSHTMVRLLLCAGLLMSAVANAQQSATKIALAEQLTTLLHLDQMFEDDAKECGQRSSTTAASAFQSYPAIFEGLSPKSAYWQEVEEVYARFRVNACKYVDSGKLTRYYVEELAKRASESDLRASISFYSSEPGKRLQGVTLELNQGLQAYASQLLHKAYEDARVQYQKEMHEIISRFRADPK